MRATTTVRTIALGVAGAALVVTGAVAPASAATKSYTLAQVKTHSKTSNCWSVVKGNVYNLTSWVNRHPGGAGVIASLCGKDGSAAFNARHGGQGGPNSMLATFKVGALKK